MTAAVILLALITDAAERALTDAAQRAQRAKAIRNGFEAPTQWGRPR